MPTHRLLLSAAACLTAASAYAQMPAAQDTFPYAPARIQPGTPPADQVTPRARPNPFDRAPVDPKRDYIRSTSQSPVKATGRTLNDYRIAPPTPALTTDPRPRAANAPIVLPAEGNATGSPASAPPPAALPVENGAYLPQERARRFNAHQEMERLRLKCNGGDRLSCETLRNAQQPPVRQPAAPDPRQFQLPPGGVLSPDQPSPEPPPAPDAASAPPPPQPAMPRYYQDMNGRVYRDPIPMDAQER